MMCDEITLIERKRAKPGEETKRTALGEVNSIGQNEKLRAGEYGMRAELMAKIWKYDFRDEPIVEIRGKKLSIYRTFVEGNFVKLYCGEKTGVR